jgi:hypothetical protein
MDGWASLSLVSPLPLIEFFQIICMKTRHKLPYQMTSISGKIINVVTKCVVVSHSEVVTKA